MGLVGAFAVRDDNAENRQRGDNNDIGRYLIIELLTNNACNAYKQQSRYRQQTSAESCEFEIGKR